MVTRQGQANLWNITFQFWSGHGLRNDVQHLHVVKQQDETHVFERKKRTMQWHTGNGSEQEQVMSRL
jgi:hypothetical protein